MEHEGQPESLQLSKVGTDMTIGAAAAYALTFAGQHVAGNAGLWMSGMAPIVAAVVTALFPRLRSYVLRKSEERATRLRIVKAHELMRSDGLSKDQRAHLRLFVRRAGQRLIEREFPVEKD